MCASISVVFNIWGDPLHILSVQLSLFWSLVLWALAILVSLYFQGEFLLLNLGNLWCSPTVPFLVKWSGNSKHWAEVMVRLTLFVSHLSGITVFLLSDIKCRRSHFSRIFVWFFSLVISGRTNSVLFYSFWPEANLKLVCYWFFNLGSPLLLLHLCPLLLKSETHEHFTEFYVGISIIFIFLILVLSNRPIKLSVVSREISNSGSVAF